MEVSCKISGNKTEGYQVFLNDVDVSPYITSFDIKLDSHHKFPVLTVDVLVASLDFDGASDLIENHV